MRLSAKTRYGVRMMIDLALNYGRGPLLLKEIARREAISEKFLGQIVIVLRAAGLVDSIRGKGGGYILSRPPSQITLREVVEALEEGLELVECLGNPRICSRVSLCVSRVLWKNLNDQIHEFLNSTTLEDMVKIYREKLGNLPLYSI